ncbi:MAG TPA: hypothetical protein VK994_05035, partial [Bacteroidales bacterium]|nr:hypothetical protein [Bacteroidales bacterium]
MSKIHELARALAEVRVEGGGLMSGAAGLACFHANYADWTGDLHFEELAADMLEIALNPAAGYFNDLRFSDGLAGILWTID